MSTTYSQEPTKPIVLNFQDVLNYFRTESFSQRDKGTRFEVLMQKFLRIYPLYKGMFKEIWMWNEFPYKDQFSGKDTGIDLVALTHDEEFWAIQCKCVDKDTYIDKPAVDTFLSTSGKYFEVNEGKIRFTQRLWISTTNKWNSEAENTIHNQEPSLTRLSLSQIEEASLKWHELLFGAEDKALQPKKQLRDHQKTALEKVHSHFEQENRARIIMACGTGKTFTSLKIAENETQNNGMVLFLVPSIALLGQTLIEWSAEAEYPIKAICVCSDSEITKKKTKNDEDVINNAVEDLALPASTNISNIVRQLQVAQKSKEKGMIVVFSTYQSIEVISQAQKQLFAKGKQAEFDLIICDEAHRTTGVTLKDTEESAFVKVHDNICITAKKRLYMTATPRLYKDDMKAKAKDADAVLCSMDDVSIYGEEVYRIGFGEAVDKKLLSDYKVLILTMKESQIPAALQNVIDDTTKEVNTDDVSKLIGCINALSKKMLIDDGLLRESDPNPMHTAVAFCQNIKISKKTTNVFNEHKEDYYNSLTQEERAEIVSVSADHIDGTMGASLRGEKLSWLKSTPTDGNECRILTNVRCLSEGVDVPSLDAVMFLSARNSQVDVVQSVGRVMRVAKNKKYGYIIIPVVIPSNENAEEALDNNERYKVVWTVLNALRAHDDRFNAMVSKIELNSKKPKDGGSVIVGGIAPTYDTDNESSNTKPKQESPKHLYLPIAEIQEIQNAIYAKMVQKVGNKRYWEQWAKDVAQIAQNYIERITRLINTENAPKQAFNDLLKDMQKNINPSVSKEALIEMLAQHLITQPVFEALFENYSFVKSNPVSKALQEMVELLESHAMDKDNEVLSRFYESVKFRVSHIDNAQAKQNVIIELYDKFFKTAFPKVVEQLGIVYTPVEVVDFINHSVAEVLKKEFGRNLSDENVHILDPFTGTGTFITRLIQSGLIDKTALPRKYTKELHANELVLLAYYIASINIENVYHDTLGNAEYTSFEGICLTDTFQLSENKDLKLYTPKLAKNSSRVEAQMKAPIQVIIGNPPYSAGQNSENDNAQNQSYPLLDKRVADTYAKFSNTTNVSKLYDSYIKAFRWASDRLGNNEGIISFVSNAGWIDTQAMDGMRKCLEEDFASIYIFNLRGNQRTSGELSRKEGGKIFGSGSRTPIAITLLIKKANLKEKAKIYYHDIGDYLSREDKLQIVEKFKSIHNINMSWELLQPNEHYDWLNLRNDTFSTFISLGDKKNPDEKTIFETYSRGIATSRDAWNYNYSSEELSKNMTKMINFYSEQVHEQQRNSSTFEISYDATKIAWSRGLKESLAKSQLSPFSRDYFRISSYRPYTKQFFYYDRFYIDQAYVNYKFFPTSSHKNFIITLPGIGSSKDFSSLIIKELPDLSIISPSQCFPLYYYEENKVQTQASLLDTNESSKYTRKDAISDFILQECRNKYGHKVTKEDIFYYVYGILHSKEYRETFKADLKKMLPRIPLVETNTLFFAFSKAGRDLAHLHLNYETIPPYADVKVTGEESDNFIVEKIRFQSKNNKSVIFYNPYIKIENIPEKAYEYVVNGKSALEWILDRYQVKIDKDSQIKNDPNDWAKEHNKPRYILDLLLSIINVSVQSVDIVNNLPKLTFEEGHE